MLIGEMVPPNPNSKKAPEGSSWEAPSLSDFTTKGWSELSDSDKKEIAKHFAYCPSYPPKTFGEMKFPHHRPSDGAVVFAACSSAMGRMNQADISASEKKAVMSHMEAHYKQFDKEMPKSMMGKKMMQSETYEQFIESVGDTPVWESISDSTETFVLEEDLGYGGYIAEADSGSPFNSEGLLPVLLIRQGWSKNKRWSYDEKGTPIEVGRYYTPEAIKSLVPFLGYRTAVNIDHEMPWGPPRGMRDWAAEIKKSEVKELSGKMAALAELELLGVGPTAWIKEVIERFPSKIGMSTMANVTAKRGKVAGREADIVQVFNDMISNDFVRYPGIEGAGIRRSRESFDSNGIRDLKIEKDSEGRIHFYEWKGRKFYLSSESFNHEPMVRNTSNEEDDESVEKPTVSEAVISNIYELRAKFPELVDQALKTAREDWERDNKAIKEVETLKAENTDLKTKVTTLETERNTLKTELDNVKTARLVADRKEKVRTLLAEAKLDINDPVHVSEVFLEMLDAQGDEAKVKAMIEDRKVIVFTRDGVGNGERKVESPKTTTAPKTEPKPMTLEQELEVLQYGKLVS